MRTSERLTQQEIMRCIADGGPAAGQHMAALERQKWALAKSEVHAALKANPARSAAPLMESATPDGIQLRLSLWLRARLVSVGHRLEDSAA